MIEDEAKNQVELLYIFIYTYTHTDIYIYIHIHTLSDVYKDASGPWCWLGENRLNGAALGAVPPSVLHYALQAPVAGGVRAEFGRFSSQRHG